MEQIINEPILFTPYFKNVLWGGNKICQYKGISQQGECIGESWEISSLPGYVSVVKSGRYKGLSLNELIDRFGEQLLGDRVYAKYSGKFPLLVKLIDASDNLSIQVHPNDELAKERHNCMGKTEMWYIISTDKDSRIYAGLSRQITPDEYEKKVADGSFTDVITIHGSKPGDFYFLPAGCVHAIGTGNFLAEIQESSDITYRIFDYNRKDKNGNLRELHTSLAKDAIDYTVRNHKIEPKPDGSGAIVACEHFNVKKVIVDGEIVLKFKPDSFTVIMCIEGDITYSTEEGICSLAKGHTILLPATMTEFTVTGKATLLIARS
ncbi:MAG: mannose-6-phosphate isomerase [Lachnoclostridium sp.]|nr:mannose-6-phosphate isomerase [Lachnoclostridium sp.]